MKKINGEILQDIFLRESSEKVISIGKEFGFDLKISDGRMIKESSMMYYISPDLWIVLKFFGGWAGYKILDEFYEMLKGFVKKVKNTEEAPLIIEIKDKDKSIIINLNLEDSSNLDTALNKLEDYLKNNNLESWQWYNEELEEWGDIDKVEEWK